MAEVSSRASLALQVIATGTHLSESHGATWREISADGFVINEFVEMAIATNDAEGTARSAAQVLCGVTDALVRLRPHIIVLLGDRFELLAAAQAAVFAGIPIAHIHGGEASEGAIDESIRNAVTKLAQWHFASAERYASRIRQMGEAPDRVWNVGALATDNIAALKSISKGELEAYLGIQLTQPIFLVTYHPVTLANDSGLSAIDALLEALDALNGTIVITGVNADPGAGAIRATLQSFATQRPNRVAVVESLGSRRYLSLMRIADVVVGNSSSGLLEAPVIGTPTVDIGTRQQGRIRPRSVLNCGGSALEISQALKIALSAEHRAIAALAESPYGKPGAAKRIADQLQSVDSNLRIKPFVGCSCTNEI